MLRKIVEVCNEKNTKPAADWSDEWLDYKSAVKRRQLLLCSRGTVEFLCKHLAEETDDDIREECVLVCIALL
jgi:hypothetical protein